MPSIPGLARLDDRQRGALALVVGTLLVVNPLYVTAFHVGSSYYQYQTAPVHAADGEIVVDVGENERVHDGIANVGCTGDQLRRTRACAMDRNIAEHGPVNASDDYEGGADYVRIDGSYYERVVREVDGTERLDLRPVSAATALEGAAISRGSLTWPGRVAMLTGGVTTTYPLTNGGHVVETDEGYRLVYLAGFNAIGAGGGDAILSFAVVLAGLWLLVRGYRRLPDD